MADRTFRPVILDDGTILAGGLRIAQLRESCLVFEDDFHPRANKRQTPDVPVDLRDLMDAVLERMRLDNV